MNSKNQQTVLIIDNDDGIVKAISTRLELLGYHCLTAANGAQGISLFSQQPIDLIITDLNMPGIDGIELVNQFKTLSNVPIIVVTGFEKEYLDQLNQFEDLSILQKPFEAQSLIDIVTMELTLNAA